MNSIKKTIRMSGVDFAMRMNDLHMMSDKISTETYVNNIDFLSRVRSMIVSQNRY